MHKKAVQFFRNIYFKRHDLSSLPLFLIFLSPVTQKVHCRHRKESDKQYDSRPKTRRFIIPVLNHHCDFLGNGTVFPGIFPASIDVAPYSPSALANASTVPESTPGPADGMTTFQKIFHSDIPSVRAA